MRYETIPPALEANCDPSVRRQVRPASSGLRLLAAVLYEAIAAHSLYERLKRRGLDDASAVRQAFFGPSIGDETQGAMQTPCQASAQVPLASSCDGETTWDVSPVAGGSADPIHNLGMPTQSSPQGALSAS